LSASKFVSKSLIRNCETIILKLWKLTTTTITSRNSTITHSQRH